MALGQPDLGRCGITEVVGACYVVPASPGLGIEINEDLFAEATDSPSTRRGPASNPIGRIPALMTPTGIR